MHDADKHVDALQLHQQASTGSVAAQHLQHICCLGLHIGAVAARQLQQVWQCAGFANGLLPCVLVCSQKVEGYQAAPHQAAVWLAQQGDNGVKPASCGSRTTDTKAG